MYPQKTNGKFKEVIFFCLEVVFPLLEVNVGRQPARFKQMKAILTNQHNPKMEEYSLRNSLFKC